jgi:uncharacterized protein with GYD domain
MRNLTIAEPGERHPDVASVERVRMPLYSQQVTYTHQMRATLLDSPDDRLPAIRSVVQRLGGTVVSGWLAFGDYDALVICDLPDNESAAALSMAVSAGGAVQSVRMTPLLPFEQGAAVRQRAKDAEYVPPRADMAYFGIKG